MEDADLDRLDGGEVFEGTKTFPNGTLYFGEMRSGRANGKGILNFPVTGDKYFGDFVDDRMNGKGTMTYRNGVKYEGDFRDD